DLEAAHVLRLGQHPLDAATAAATTAALEQLALELGDLLLELLLVGHQLAELLDEIAALGLHHGAGAIDLVLHLAHLAQGVEAGRGEDATPAGGDAAVALDLEQADVAEGPGVRPATQLDAVLGHRQHADDVAVLLLEDGDGALLARLVDGEHLGEHRRVLEDL